MTAAVLLLLAPTPLVRGSTDELETLKKLLAAQDQRFAELTIACRFVLTHGYAHTDEAALNGEIDLSIPDEAGSPYRVFRATGHFYKLGKKVRYAVDFGQPPVELDRGALGPVGHGIRGGGPVGNVGFDEVTDGRIDLRSHPPSTGNYSRIISVTAQNDRLRGRSVAGHLSDAYQSPLAPFGRNEADAILSEAAAKLSLTKIEGNRMEVLTESGSPRSRRRIVFWLDASPPVIERLDHETWNALGQKSQWTDVHLDFLKCGGGVFALKAITVHKRPGKLPWVKCWESQDLGDRVPTDADFVIEFPAGTYVVGLKRPPRLDQPFTIDVSKIDEAALLTPGSPAPTQESGPPPLTRKAGPIVPTRDDSAQAENSWSWPWFANGAVATLLVVGLLIRRAQKAKSASSANTAP